MHTHTIDNTFAKSKHTVHLENDLRVRAIVMSHDSETGFSSVDYTLKADNGPYDISLIQNPLIDYNQAMAEIERMTNERKAFKAVYGQQMEPSDCSWRHIMAIWSVAHWYQVDEFVGRMTVGMSVAAWEGLNRTHKIFA